MTLEKAFTLFGPILVALFATATSIYAVRSNRGKNRADASSSMASASQMTIDDLMQQITFLNVQAAAMLLRDNNQKVAAKRSLELIARLFQGINMLLAQVRMASMTPDWLPDPEIERLVALCTEESDRLAIPKISVNRESVTSP
jgi:hypothetical protein